MSEINIQPDGPAQVDRSGSFTESLVAQKKASNQLNQMIANNKAEATSESIATEASDLSVMGQTNRLLRAPKKETDIDKLKRIYEDRTKVFARKEDADGFADQFSRREGNREYHLDPLILSALAFEDLGLKIHEDSEVDDILAIVQDRMSQKGDSVDPALLDKGLEFLVETTQSQINRTTGKDKDRLTKICSLILEAKDKHFEMHSVEIEVAGKIIGAVDAVITATGTNIKETLGRYREIVHNPPELQVLRRHFETKGYKEMKVELVALSRYLNVNFKRKNLENAELGQLAKAARKMQALDHVFLEARNQTKTFLNGYIKSNHLAPAA